MKLALLTAFCLLSALNASAQDAADRVIAYHRQKALDNEDELKQQAETKLGYCIRDLVENGGGGFKGFDDAVKFMEKLQTFPYRPSWFIQNRVRRCEYLKAFYSKHKDKAINRPTKLDFVRVNESRIDKKAFKVLTSILYPRIECRKISVSVGVALYWGGGAKVEGARCKSTTGRRWVELRLGGGGRTESGLFNVDIGIAMKDARNSVNRRNPFMTQDYVQDGGHFIGGYSEDKKTNSHSGGIGVGVYDESGTMGVLRTISLDNDEVVRGLVTALY